MLHALKSEEEQLGISAEGFGSFGDTYGNVAADTRKSYRLQNHGQSGIIQSSRKAMFKPLVGLFNQDKLTPLRYCPSQIEMELVIHGADAVFVDLVIAGETNVLQIGILVMSNASVTCLH